MAYTNSILAKSVHGNMRVQFHRLTADAATAAIDTGLGYVDGIGVALQSATTAAIKFAINELAAGTAAAGYVSVTGAASGDEIVLTVYGR